MMSLNGVSGMKPHRDIGVTRKMAWFMLYRIRKSLDDRDDGESGRFSGPVEADKTYVGRLERNRHEDSKPKGVMPESW